MMILIFAAVLVLLVWLFMQLPQFGKSPAGDRMLRIKSSPNYKNGAFQNLSHTPALTEGAKYSTVFRDFFFGKSKRSKPTTIIPTIKTDLKNLDPNTDVVVWFGHSSYFMQLSGKKILVDPVFSGNASPFNFTTRSFEGADAYTADDMPDIDYLFISHDHYDHLDHRTVVALQPKVKTVITGLGVGAHLERWGYSSDKIIEKDWNEQVILGDGFIVNTAPVRHFSGRRFKRNGTLWTSFILTTPARKIYLGGDSGYDSHFKVIGDQYGPFDLVILEDGQYDQNWKYIHMLPEEVVQAATDLKAKTLFPVHWAKFALGLHDWDDPILRVVAESKKRGMPTIHPMIGEAVNLDKPAASREWWQGIH